MHSLTAKKPNSRVNDSIKPLITINGQKMGKSIGYFITLEQFFTGNHLSLEQPYSPMTIRFFILSAHCRGTVDFSNDAQKGMQKLMDGLADIERIAPQAQSDSNVHDFVAAFRQKRQASRSRTPKTDVCGNSTADFFIGLRSKV